MLWTLLTSRLAGPIASAAALGLAVALGVTTFQKVGLERDVARLEVELAERKADLLTCRNNTATLESAIIERNNEIQRVAQMGADKIRAAEDAVTAAKGQTARANARINLLLTTPTGGDTVCERVDEIDRAVQEAFK